VYPEKAEATRPGDREAEIPMGEVVFFDAAAKRSPSQAPQLP
jgi:hypothetical protein